MPYAPKWEQQERERHLICHIMNKGSGVWTLGMRKVFGPEVVGVTGSWSKLYNENFIICTCRQLLLGWTNQGGLERRNMQHTQGKISVGIPEGKRSLEDQGIVQGTVREWLWKNRVEGCGMDSFVSEYEPVVGSSEHGNEPSGSIKFGEFLD
jgi:hypothetical protein